jgi:homocysteine S-methyltransferase
MTPAVIGTRAVHRTPDPANPLTPFFDWSELIIVDGGLATELETRGHDLNDALWSARLLIDDPDAIRQVHTDYLRAGADCIITASYQASVQGFVRRGMTDSEAERLIRFSVDLALQARDAFWARPEHRADRLRPIVAASVGPYGATMADGSEYTGEYDLDEEGLLAFHRRRWYILAQSDADLLACETIPSLPEARALARLLSATPDRFAWFSFSCRDGRHISDGTPISECARWLNEYDRVAAVGVNCTPPRYIPELVSSIRSTTDLPIIVYPNSGEHYDVATRSWSGLSDEADFARQGRTWCQAGAAAIGGCCRTGPDHIRRLRALLLEESS